MKRHELEKFLNKYVKIDLFDNTSYQGILTLGNGYFVKENQKYKDYYLDGAHMCFKLSHVRSIKNENAYQRRSDESVC